MPEDLPERAEQQEQPPNPHNAWIARIGRALRDDDQADLTTTVLQITRDNIRESQAAMRRSFLGAVLLGLLFLVIGGGSATEVEVFGVKLSELTVVAITIPVGITYFGYDAAFNFALVDLYRQLLAAIVPILSPKLGPTNAHRLLYPPTASLMGESLHFGPEARPRGWREQPRVITAFDGLVWVGVMVSLGAAFAFVAYCYIRLFDDHGVGNLGVWISLMVSLTFLARLVLLRTAARAVLESEHTLPGYVTPPR